MKSDRKIIHKTLAERGSVLQDKPILKKYQEEIDGILDKTPGSSVQRCEVLEIMIKSKLIEKRKKMREMLNILQTAEKSLGFRLVH
jgi:hypothetical protein